jgi:hypothetical protein
MDGSNAAFQNDTIVRVKGGVIVRLGNLAQEKEREVERGDEGGQDADRRLMRVNTNLSHPHLIYSSDWR